MNLASCVYTITVILLVMVNMIACTAKMNTCLDVRAIVAASAQGM